MALVPRLNLLYKTTSIVQKIVYTKTFYYYSWLHLTLFYVSCRYAFFTISEKTGVPPTILVPPYKTRYLVKKIVFTKNVYQYVWLPLNSIYVNGTNRLLKCKNFSRFWYRTSRLVKKLLSLASCTSHTNRHI